MVGMLSERWLPVVGYERTYEVSDQGRVRSLPRRNTSGRVIAQRWRWRYLTVDLWQDGKRSTKLVHRLVAEAFIPNPGELPEVNHLDHERIDNSVGNLEWSTHQQNSMHTNWLKLGKAGALRSPEGKVVEFDCQAKFCREHGLTKSAVCCVVNGTRNSHKGWSAC